MIRSTFGRALVTNLASVVAEPFLQGQAKLLWGEDAYLQSERDEMANALRVTLVRPGHGAVFVTIDLSEIGDRDEAAEALRKMMMDLKRLAPPELPRFTEADLNVLRKAMDEDIARAGAANLAGQYTSPFVDLAERVRRHVRAGE